MTGRPLVLLLAIVVLALAGVGAAGFGILLDAMAGDALASIQPFGAILPASGIAFGLVALGGLSAISLFHPDTRRALGV